MRTHIDRVAVVLVVALCVYVVIRSGGDTAGLVPIAGVVTALAALLQAFRNRGGGTGTGADDSGGEDTAT